jgi:protein TonB
MTTPTTSTVEPRAFATDPAMRRLAGLRTLVGGLSTLASAGALVTALVLLDDAPEDTRKVASETVVRFEVEAPKKPPKKRREERARTTRTTRAAHAGPSAPSLGTAISLPSFARDDALGMGDATLGEDIAAKSEDVVMTDDTVDEAPRALTRASPVHPARARKAGIEGEVTIALLIDTDGSVKDPRVVSATPPDVFDEAALDAIAKWRFSPARYRGEAVRVKRTLTFTFALE